jgi:tetratricopeptide (TPR) repeat protein
MNIRPLMVSTLVVLVLFPALSPAQLPESMFSNGNAYYQQGKYGEARDAYEKILNNGYTSGPLLFNLGNTYYKLGNIAKAIVCYERARKLIPGDDDLLHNLQLANLQIADRIEPTPRLFIWDTWESIKNAFSLESITWIGYCLYIACLAFVGILIISRSYVWRKVGLLSAVVALCMLILSAGVFAGKLTEVISTDDAVVMTSLATVKNSPDPKSSDAFVLHSGVKLKITDRVNDWLKIRLDDGKVGWIEQKAVEVI